MDLLRFQKFTVGYAWVSNYGSSDNADEFENLRGISPLHNIKDKDWNMILREGIRFLPVAGEPLKKQFIH